MATVSGINCGQYISGQNTVNQNVHNHYPSSPGVYPGIDILLGASEPDAAVDADARAYSPRCFPGTREQYIEDITCWATASSDVQSILIYRMKGPAGVGKSAIAQTCTERVNRQGKLGAAFFFSNNRCNNHKRFFTTIAYQLSTVLPEYKQNLNDRILNDKTLVNKTIASQFEKLIIGPLQELEKLGREVGMRTIFVDGLDECQNPNAQSEIIEVIATSVQNRTTPFRWVFFSRAEAHIEATFNLDCIAPLARTVELPISRKADQEIQLYLEGGFKNILRRQSISSSMPWPPPEAIRKLVNASAGLYAYPAVVLRFIDSFPTGDPKEALAVVLDVISQPSSHISSLSPFAELDAFYMLIMRRIPDHTVPLVQLLLSRVYFIHPDLTNEITYTFNSLHLSEAVLNTVRKHLHAVVHFRDATAPIWLGADVDATRPFYEQRHPSDQEKRAILSSLGSLAFYHKSFYDFLCDPARSATFCVCMPEMQERMFERELQSYSNFAQSYEVQGTELVLKPGAPHSADVLSFPLQNEYSNTYMQHWLFYSFPFRNTLVVVHHCLIDFHEITHDLLQKLSDLDYRKYLLVRCFGQGPRLTQVSDDIKVRICSMSEFRHAKNRDSTTFFKAIKIFKRNGIIKPYTPTPRLKNLLPAKRSGPIRSGLYTLGQGEKMVYRYWEFDMESKELYEFWTLDLAGAAEIFQANKYKMWSPNWRPPPHRPSDSPLSIMFF